MERMMEITAQQVKELRDMTGAAMMACKKALVEAGGDMEKARTVLREKGLAKALAKATRETAEGIVEPYVHGNGRIGVLVQLACETDFVARSGEFGELAREIAMQIAAMSPVAVRPEDLPEEMVAAEREVQRQQVADKPANIQERIIEGKMAKFYAEACLLKQPYIRDEAGSMTIEELIKEKIAKLGENIEVKRFVRLEVGT
jgi:elongation factor Ts